MPPVGQANRLQEDAVYAYQYDFEGNRTRRTNKTTGAYEEYTWDHRNRLTRVTSKTAGGTVTRDSQYARDMFDRRIKKIVDLDGSGPGLAVTTRHVYDGDHVALAYDGASSLTNRYLHGPVIDQVLVDELIGTGNRWALTDHLGTVHDYIDNNGNFVERVGRNSFGLPVTDTAPTVDLLFGYWGRDWDPETQMTDARSRPLDHRTIKFVKEDDKGHGAGDPNLYRDVVNSPTHFTDPYGHQGRPLVGPPAPPTSGLLPEEAAGTTSEYPRRPIKPQRPDERQLTRGPYTMDLTHERDFEKRVRAYEEAMRQYERDFKIFEECRLAALGGATIAPDHPSRIEPGTYDVTIVVRKSDYAIKVGEGAYLDILHSYIVIEKIGPDGKVQGSRTLGKEWFGSRVTGAQARPRYEVAARRTVRIHIKDPVEVPTGTSTETCHNYTKRFWEILTGEDFGWIWLRDGKNLVKSIMRRNEADGQKHPQE